jgi:hypothetical protein
MAGIEKIRTNPGSLEVEEEFREEVAQREDARLTIEQNHQQDLNQGMDTGTHSSIHRGVNWGPAYRVLPQIEPTHPMKERIRARAYELYQHRGGEDGQGLEDWLTAEKELKLGNQ